MLNTGKTLFAQLPGTTAEPVGGDTNTGYDVATETCDKGDAGSSTPRPDAVSTWGWT